MKKMVLCAMVMCLLLSTAVASEPPYIDWILSVAKEEIGYEEGDNNATKYGLWSGDEHAQWCAEFLCWVVNEVDRRHHTSLLTVVYPNYSGQNTGRDWFLQRNRFVYRTGYRKEWGKQWFVGENEPIKPNSYQPKAGDWMFFSYHINGDTVHVALVEKCFQDTDGTLKVQVIEGNNPSEVARKTYNLTDQSILGYGLPEKLVWTEIRYGNSGPAVTNLQQSLHTIGLLDPVHITGTFSGNTKKAIETFQKETMDMIPTGIADMKTMVALTSAFEMTALSDPNNWLVVE